MEKIIEVKNISKKYYYHKTLPLLAVIKKIFNKEIRMKEVFWALKDINFEVYRGDKLALIGDNGAGKSTILKILSRVIFPSEGEATINGKIVSLLELGTGFHPDLNGYENIFLNGSLLGMTNKKIKDQLNHIINFADLKEFINMPIKHYSSGMFVKLGFAIAIHADADILIIDEALSVGDMDFQKKCLKKIKEIADSGKTIIFVSHDVEVLRSTCDRAILLKQGKIVAQGKIEEIIENYIH